MVAELDGGSEQSSTANSPALHSSVPWSTPTQLQCDAGDVPAQQIFVAPVMVAAEQVATSLRSPTPVSAHASAGSVVSHEHWLDTDAQHVHGPSPQ